MEKDNDIPVEPEAIRKERIALSKTLTTKPIPSKLDYTRKDKYGKLIED